MLHKETVEPETLDLLKKLMLLPDFRQFRLVGGTALSLLFGHRKSIDLDLFTDEPFDRETILYTLQTNFSEFTFADQKSPRLLFTTINKVKVDFVHTFERFFSPVEVIDEIRFASPPEIIALKLNAIAGRGAKKDFWDLNTLLKAYSLEQMFNFYQERYPNNSLMMVVKSIPYFVEADFDIDPICFKECSWDNIKNNILKAFNKYINTDNGC
ncbi:MAG: nucleotidyl transferase AbiEii/AbiGii toxin family protein [Pyrinomonadaceae bacterium]|nr:nucleotidyl transferase AbiEii/AbiGii toxin family protein [Sphingobacteriaceae bacterium]